MTKLKKDSAFNFFSALHLQRYLKGHKGYIAGGCFKNIFKKQSVKDVDIFFKDRIEFDEAIEVFDNNEGYSKTYENDNATGYYDKEKDVSVDLVKSQFSEPDDMITNFDFTITKFAMYWDKIELDEQELAQQEANKDDSQKESELKEEPERKTHELRVVYHEDFFEHLTLNRLVIDEDLIPFPLNTFDRMMRYAKYGYAPCTGTKAKIVRAINSVNLPDDDANLFKGFYVGID